MNLNKYLPTDALKPFVKHFMVVETDQGRVNKILPDTNLVMAFRFKGETSIVKDGKEIVLPNAAITGLRNSFNQLKYNPQSATILTLFTEWGAATFFKEPLHELFGYSLPLDHFIKSHELSIVSEQLEEAETHKQRISIVEQFLLSRLNGYKVDPLIQAAVEQIKISNGNVKIKQLSNMLNISQDPFEKRFRKIIGATPKQFSTTVRLRSLINFHSTVHQLTETAYSAGYFDQSHFIKDFKSFTGETPRDFFKNSSFW